MSQPRLSRRLRLELSWPNGQVVSLENETQLQCVALQLTNPNPFSGFSLRVFPFPVKVTVAWIKCEFTSPCGTGLHFQPITADDHTAALLSDLACVMNFPILFRCDTRSFTVKL